MLPHRSARALVTVALLVFAAGCGDDDEDGADQTAAATADTDTPGDSVAPSDTAADPTDAAPATTTTTGRATATTAAATEDEGSDDDAFVCPSAADVGTVFASEVVAVSEMAMAGGLFCPYESADGSLDVSTYVTFTTAPITDEAALTGTETAVPGVGEEAYWNEGVGQLVVWAGEYGLIVDIPFAPPEVDQLAAAVAMAELAMA